MKRYIEKFLRYLEYEKNASSYTLTCYRGDLEAFERSVGETPIEKIDMLSLRRFLADLKAKNLQKITVARKLSSLRSFFKFLCREGHLKTNPTAGLRTPKQEKRLPKVLGIEEVSRLLEGASNDFQGLRDRAILETLYSSGLRVSELTQLDLPHVDSIGGVVKVAGKGKKSGFRRSGKKHSWRSASILKKEKKPGSCATPKFFL